MKTYPAAGDYYKAVQAPTRVFTVPKLQAARFVQDALGPTLARGSSAVVFQAAVDGSPQALRCYIRDDASSWERYSALGEFVARHDLGPAVSPVTWIDSAIRVNGASWPVLLMPWIDGRTLNEYVDFLVARSDAAALTVLAAKWQELIALLQRAEFAHGDLQHGNILVDTHGTLRLVDFDGIWIPQLAGLPAPSEHGHPNYQHPHHYRWDRWLDSFSALVIYLSLVALGRDPALWLALYNSKNLLFSKSDFYPPFDTPVWKQLASLRDPQVDTLAQRLRECCDRTWVSGMSLEILVDPRPVTPTLRPMQVGPRWWEQPSLRAPSAGSQPVWRPTLPAPPPLSTPLGTAGTGLARELRPAAASADTGWWTASPEPSAQPPRPVLPTPPSSAAVSPSPARARQISGAIGLGLGVLLLVIGSVINQIAVLLVGGALITGGIWWLMWRGR
jgi:eukaryotic-like serine/threonine-protein kinase